MSTYSSSLRIELPSDGTQAGTWGDTTNSNLAYILDTSVAGYQTVSVTAASQALTYTNGPTSTAASNQAVYAMLRFTTTTGAAFAVYAPPASKAYIIWNNSGYSLTIYNSSVIGNTTAAGTGVTVTNNSKIMVWSDATNFYELQAANLTGTLAIANGGTGQVTANAALNALLPSQTSNANKYLQTDGTNTSWDTVSLSTADITGTLPIANGGTNATSASAARTSLGLAIGTDVPSPTGTGASGTWSISISGNATNATNPASGGSFITTSNYNSYTPTLTGTGASGTWGISISGNAATATNVAYSGLTGTVPTWNQNTTGNAATATTAANGGVTSVNGQTGAVSMTTYGAIGSYVVAGCSDFNTVSTIYPPGTDVAGSTLSRSFGNAGGNPNSVFLNAFSAGNVQPYTAFNSYGDSNLGLSGTWRSMTMTYISSGYPYTYPLALFVRVS